MADVVSTNNFRNGMHIALDGQFWRIVEFQHVKPGKGGAFVRTKLKALESGAVVDKTFRAGEKMPRVRTEVKDVTYLYNDGADVHLMDTETFDQLALPADSMTDELRFMRENDTIQLLFVDGSPSGVQLPAAVELTIRQTDPGVQGDRSTGGTKPATLETGAQVQVPLFITTGERVKVDTRTGEYLGRA